MEIDEFIEPELRIFCKVANAQALKNPFCNKEEQKLWKRIIPPFLGLQQNPEEHNETIIIDSDDEESEMNSKLNDENLSLQHISPLDHHNNFRMMMDSHLITEYSNNCDLASAVKENLETQQFLNENVMRDLKSQTRDDLKKVYDILSETLDHEEIHNLGVCIQSEFSRSSDIAISYLKYLFIPQLRSGFWDSLKTLLENYICRSPHQLKNELANNLIELPNKILLQYIKHLDNKFKSDILMVFVNGLARIEEIHLEVIDNLLNNTCEEQCLRKILHRISSVSENFSGDKVFGKIVTKMLKLLNEDYGNLKAPLERILNCHRSVWRSKILKYYKIHCRDSMSFTQM